jgi:hypothetical protein
VGRRLTRQNALADSAGHPARTGIPRLWSSARSVERLPELATELARLNVSVVVAIGHKIDFEGSLPSERDSNQQVKNPRTRTLSLRS